MYKWSTLGPNTPPTGAAPSDTEYSHIVRECTGYECLQDRAVRPPAEAA
jgi:hypothetical protein